MFTKFAIHDYFDKINYILREKTMEARDLVTEEIEYNRPIFTFPDLNGEHGNPIYYWKEAISAVRKNGFKKEADEIINHYSASLGPFYVPLMEYKKQFNFLAHYLDFQTNKEILSEDENYVYIRVKKEGDSLDFNIKQPMLFNIKHLDTLVDLLEAGEDFSIHNCYGRNILYYADNIGVLTFLLNHNQKEKIIDLFELDNFNSNILHAYDNIECKTLILNHMFQQNPELTKLYFFGENKFETNAAKLYLKELDRMFAKKGQTEIHKEDWVKFSDSLKIIKKLDESFYQDILNTVKNLPIFKLDAKEPDKQNLMKQYLDFLKLETELYESNFSKRGHKI